MRRLVRHSEDTSGDKASSDVSVLDVGMTGFFAFDYWVDGVPG